MYIDPQYQYLPYLAVRNAPLNVAGVVSEPVRRPRVVPHDRHLFLWHTETNATSQCRGRKVEGKRWENAIM